MNEKKLGSSLDLAKWIAQNLDRKGGQEITIIDTRRNDAIADFLVVATGTSQKHLETLLESPCRELKASGNPPISIEGAGTQWFLADLGDVVLHIFDNQTRNYFDIDGLWNEAPRISWNDKKNQKLQIL
ncbi:MAG: ribosome silencing factor [Bdellovibrionota bacterium]